MPLLFRQNDQLLGRVLEDQVSVGRLGVEHGEGELVRHLLSGKLLCILQQVDEGVQLLVADLRGGDDGVGLDLAEVAALVVTSRRTCTVTAKKFVIGGQLIPGPPFFPLPVAVFHDGRVLDEGNVTAALNQTSEGSCVAVVIFHLVSVAVTAGSAMTEVAEVAVLPVVFLFPHLEVGRLGT